jgi:Replication-relaxation
MKLMPRDIEILTTISKFRLATREQIERLHFPPVNGHDHLTRTSSVRHRLKLLFHHRYVERLPVPVNRASWAWRPVYRLAKKGAEVIACEQGVSLSQLSYWGKGFDAQSRRGRASHLFVDHLLKINDVRTAVMLAAEEQGYQIEQWIDDATLKSEVRKEYVTLRRQSGLGTKVAVIPDGYFVINLGTRRAHFFLELDQATMGSQRWKTKVLAYKKYLESGKYQERYKTKSLRILTVTTTEKRLKNLRQITEKAGGGRIFWFTTQDKVEPNQIFSGSIWSVGGEEQAWALLTV